jgi:hypothetical protein
MFFSQMVGMYLLCRHVGCYHVFHCWDLCVLDVETILILITVVKYVISVYVHVTIYYFPNLFLWERLFLPCVYPINV